MCYRESFQGLNIHFIHAKPKNVPQGVEVLPLLLIHGWPGSVREFYEIIPILTTPQKGIKPSTKMSLFNVVDQIHVFANFFLGI